MPIRSVRVNNAETQTLPKQTLQIPFRKDIFYRGCQLFETNVGKCLRITDFHHRNDGFYYERQNSLRHMLVWF
jgi:hypothetical protein